MVASGYSSVVLDEYRRLVDTDLRLIEQSWVARCRTVDRTSLFTGSEAAESKVHDVLIGLRQVLNESAARDE